MSLFLAAPCLAEAVHRLASSAASSSLADYLIFKRALFHTAKVLSVTVDISELRVVTGLSSLPYVSAVDEFAGLYPDLSIEIERRNLQSPYYVPFGAMRDKTQGYRSTKFPSNGSSDTVSRWQSRSKPPLKFVPNTRPKAYTFVPLTAQEYADFFLGKGKSAAPIKPYLVDCAIWWFRFTDLEVRFKDAPSPEQLIEAFIADFLLDRNELDGMFESTMSVK